MSWMQLAIQGINKRQGWRREDKAEDTANQRYQERHAQNFQDLQEQRKYDQGYFKRLVAGAKDAGLHPLAALGTNIASGPVMQQASSQINSSFTPQGNYQGTSEVDKAQIRNLDANTEWVKEQSAASRLALADQSSTPDKKPLIPGHETNPPKITPTYRYLGMDLEPSPMFSDAETLENRTGELGGSIGGLPIIPADIINTIIQTLRRSIGGKNLKGNAKRQHKFVQDYYK